METSKGMPCISTSFPLSSSIGTKPPETWFEGLPGPSLSLHSRTSDGLGLGADTALTNSPAVEKSAHAFSFGLG